MKTFTFKPAWAVMLTTVLALTLLFAACPNTTNSDDEPFAAVTGLDATVGNGQITLTWTDPADDALASIEITFKSEAGNSTQPIVVDKAIQTRTVLGLTNGIEYTFTVVAVDTSGNKSAGKTVKATPDEGAINDETPPAEVTVLTPAAGNGQVTLTWTDPADEDLAYIEITFGPTAGNSTQSTTVPTAVQTRTVTGLANGTEYTFTVRAVDTTGNRSEGATTTATPQDITAPADVTGLAATAGFEQITLSWTDPADPDFDHVEITFSPEAPDVTQPISISKGAERGTVKGLENGTGYTFTVKAVDDSGNSSNGVDTGDPIAPDEDAIIDTAPPADVAGLAVAEAENGQVILTWTDPADADFHHVEIAFSSTAGNSAQPVIAARGAQTLTFTGLANDIEYTFTLKTVDTSDNKSAGEPIAATPQDTTPPAVVTGLAATPGNGQATLTWTAPADADFDHVEITGGTEPITVAKGTQSRIITGLENGTRYTFTVIAVDASGNKSGGATIPVTPEAPIPEDQSAAQLIEEGSKRLVELSLDSAVQYYESAYTKDNNHPGAIVYSSIAKLASIARDQKVQDLMKNRFGISSYPGTIDALVSGSWLMEYPDKEFVSWYYDEQNFYSIQWRGEHPKTGGLFDGGSMSADGQASSPDWVLDESAYDTNGPGYYRTESVRTSFVLVSDEPHYNYDWPINEYYDPERESWVSWHDEGDNGAGYYDDGLVLVSSERKYRIESYYYDYDLRVNLNWLEEGESWDINGTDVFVEQTGYQYLRHENKLVLVSKTPRYESYGHSLFPELEVPQWVETHDNYKASLTSGGFPSAVTLQLLLFSNLLDRNTNGLNNLLDQALDAVFGETFEEAATRVAKLNYDQTVSLDQTIVDAFGLTEMFGGDIVITKVEMDLLIASIRLVKATLEWIDAYNWNTDLNFLKVNWINGTNDLDTLLNSIGASALPLKNDFLKDRNNGKMAASKADFIKALDAAIGAYENLCK
jgi:chitodextrinase